MKIIKIVALWCFILVATLGAQVAQAQTEYVATTAGADVEMADALRQDGKIYVVVVVLLTVLIGMIIYLIALDRKVTRLEKQLKDDLVNR
ncbi:CcmD family protein [Pontibacter vulgaris]|uniref:CcmD family protein n=1 Tax=Pontibacter vulgaris TaxID=2905679 RepID=UPI001FA7799D|nr:hypothetical protein [Pontibacter vulgaris]